MEAELFCTRVPQDDRVLMLNLIRAGGSKMKIEVLGSCCSNCTKLYENAAEAVKQSGKEAEVIKVEDLKIIMGYGVLSTPALVIDGVVKVSGRVPKVEQIKEWFEFGKKTKGEFEKSKLSGTQK